MPVYYSRYGTFFLPKGFKTLTPQGRKTLKTQRVKRKRFIPRIGYPLFARQG